MAKTSPGAKKAKRTVKKEGRPRKGTDRKARRAKVDAVTRAHLEEAILSVGLPSSSDVEIRDGDGATLLLMKRAGAQEGLRGQPAAPATLRVIDGFLAQVPQAAFSALMMGKLAGSFVMKATAAQRALLASGATAMVESKGGVLSAVVNTTTKRFSDSIPFVPVSGAIVGLGAAWQLVSILVAQKHLFDINARLNHIERSLDDLRDLMEADLIAEIHGDVEQLGTYVRTIDSGGGNDTASEWRNGVDRMVQSARTRHRRLLDRLTKLEGVFTTDRGATWSGTTLNKAAADLKNDGDQLLRITLAVRLNALLFAACIEMLRQLGAPSAYTDELGRDIDRMVEGDDKRSVAAFQRARDSILNLTSLFRKGAEPSIRAELAAGLRDGAVVVKCVREDLAQVREFADHGPRILITVDEKRSVVSGAWLDSTELITTIASDPEKT